MLGTHVALTGYSRWHGWSHQSRSCWKRRSKELVLALVDRCRALRAGLAVLGRVGERLCAGWSLLR